ncbi:1464_t:CDS:2 [Paraglomus brasilianum]|uniref:dynamin GTPase n=1 Tax=Paraglomus brasilianum TaxID=144538 RepID=A0A9N8VIQ5_9GLOM|nr:1464_t:CDS:2 [Paraglomus brasilianum]
MVGQILKHPTFTGYRLATDAVVRSPAFRSIRSPIIRLHQIRRHSTVQATFKPIGSSVNVYSLRGSSPFTSTFRTRGFGHVNIGLGLKGTQLGGVRHLSFSSVPKLLWTAFRLPVAGVTVGVAGVGYANYKIQDMASKSHEWVSSIFIDAKDFVTSLGQGIALDLPTIDVGIPSTLKSLFTKSSNQHSLESDRPRFIKKDDDSDSNNSSPAVGAAVAVATATNLFVSGEKDEEEDNNEAKVNVTTNVQEDQFMILTKKLIEVRNILMSIDHNEALRLPSIVVIGSQSSGKTSVLEAIVGHEFLPKGSNMVTRRPIELTLIHTPKSKEEYGEFPQLGLGKIHDFKHIQQTLRDMNLAVPESECVSNKPIELRIYSPNVPDLTLIDLPGYIQVNNKNQPETLKEKIFELCEQYIKEPNIILAVCAADVDLANSEALKASRKVDPLGLRTIGVITKMDLVEPEVGATILRNSDYPLHLGYIGVVCKPPENLNVQKNITSALVRHEESFFRSNYVYSQRGIQVGVGTLRRKLMEVLEENMAKSLFSIVGAVQAELEEAKYQFKVQYNDRRITAESYVAETIDSIKHNFKDFAHSFGKPQVRHEVRTMLEQRVLDLCAELYWTDKRITDLAKSSRDDLYWQYKLDMCSAALTKSGIGRTSTQLVVDVLLANMERLASMEPLNNHPETSRKILNFTNEILRNKFHTTADQVENCVKPYKYEVECTEQEWAEGVKRSISLIEKEIDYCNKALQHLKTTVGQRKLRAAIKHVLDAEKEEVRRQARLKDDSSDDHPDALPSASTVTSPQLISANNIVESNDTVRLHVSPKLIEKAHEAIFLRDRAIILKYRLAALKSRQCKSPENKQYCPEAFLNMVAEKLTYTAVMFIQVELLTEFFFQFPREVDNKLVYDLDRKQILQFAKENPYIRKHLELQERKRKLGEVMDKLNYLVRRQRDIESTKAPTVAV